MRRNEDSLKDLWDNIKDLNISIIGNLDNREKGPETIFGELIAQNFPNMGEGNSQPSPGSTENPRQDKPNEENIDTHSNQTDQN